MINSLFQFPGLQSMVVIAFCWTQQSLCHHIQEQVKMPLAKKQLKRMILVSNDA
jgi:hypothetical protein